MGAIRQEAVRPALGKRRVGEQRSGQRLQQQRDAQLAQHVLLGGIVQVDLHGAGARHHVEAERAHLRHVAAHDGVAALRHPRHLGARAERVEAQGHETEVQVVRHAAHLVVVRLQLGHGVVQRLHRSTGQLQLSGRLQRDRRVALLQSDDLVGVGDRSAAEAALQALQQVADRAGLPVRRLVGRGGEIGEPEAELLVLGAQAELRRRLAADRKVVGKLLQRSDRRRIGVSGVGHALPRRDGFSFIGSSGSPPPATMPARRCRRSRPAGCADQGMR